MVYLTKEHLLYIHSLAIEKFGGSHGVRDYHTIIDLEFYPKQQIGGRELFPTMFSKAAVYARNIIMNHPFVDGNKRTGMLAALTFLESNGYQITASDGEVEKFAVRIVKEKLEIEKIAKWLEVHCKKVVKK